MTKIIPHVVIKSAVVDEDVIAMTYIMSHFDSYLNQLSRKTLYDMSGNAYLYTDPEIKQRLKTKLMLSILKFKLSVV